MRQLRVFFHGDSVSFGQGVSPHLTWVTRISKCISEEFGGPDTELTLANLGVNGNTTRQGLERLHYDVLSHYPQITTVQFGLNDCNYWMTDMGHPRVSEMAFKANLHEIVSKLRTFKCKWIILNSNHSTTRSKDLMPNSSVTYEASNEQYNVLIREVAREQEAHGDVIFNDINSLLKLHLGETRQPLSDFLLSDGLHLSERGHSFYFDKIYPVIRQAARSFLDSESI